MSEEALIEGKWPLGPIFGGGVGGDVCFFYLTSFPILDPRLQKGSQKTKIVNDDFSSPFRLDPTSVSLYH